MDSITQAALGAAIGHVILGKKSGVKAACVGAVVATLPDLDVILLPFYSDLQRISVHRGYSHALLVCLIAAGLITPMLSRMRWLKEVGRARLLAFSALTLVTHVLLDAFTSYGTQLFLPFSDARISFDSINIVDPVYTLPLLAGLAAALLTKGSRGRRYNYWGIAISSLYLLTTLFVKAQVERRVQRQLQQQEIAAHDLLTIPVKMGSVNWYAVAKTDSGLHLGQHRWRSGSPVDFHYFPTNDHLLTGLDGRLVDRMKWFSQGYYTVVEHEGKIRLYNMQCDMQGIRRFGDYAAPTAFYFEIEQHEDGSFDLSSGMHPKEKAVMSDGS